MTSHQVTVRGEQGAEVSARILIVDDEPNIRSFIGRALSAAGYLTAFASTGSEGLQHALSTHYDLIVLDLVMPDMDGSRVLAQLLKPSRTRPSSCCPASPRSPPRSTAWNAGRETT